jgi:hypothetical protein
VLCIGVGRNFQQKTIFTFPSLILKVYVLQEYLVFKAENMDKCMQNLNLNNTQLVSTIF